MQNHYHDQRVVTLIPGDGIGPEITQSLKQVINELGVTILWEEFDAGITSYEKTGVLIPEEIYASFEKNKVALKGPITTPIGTGFRSINVELRKRYDLYSCVRPIQSIGVVPSNYKNVDIVLFRENTEDLYMGLEEQISPDEARSIKVITRKASERIALAAFDYAIKHNRKKVTVVTKANIMKLSDGLFLNSVRDVSKNYPSIGFNEILVDNMCMQMVLNPNQFDVIVTENLYGDILSDLGAALVGGLGFVPGANIGSDKALFEATHGSAPDIAGLGIANPTAMLLSASLMLDYLGYIPESKLLKYSINKLYLDKANFTKDIKGSINTKEYTERLIKIIHELKGEFYEKNSEFDIHLDEWSKIIEQKKTIDPKLYPEHNIKRGLRNENGTGVLVGITRVGSVIGYRKENDKKIPIDGQLYYRGYNLFDLVKGFQSENRLGFEETIYLLLFGKCPNQEELKQFSQALEDRRELPKHYKEDVILKIPAPNIMNKLQRTVLTLYSYDDNPDDISVVNVLRQSIDLIAKLPLLAAYSYQAKRHYFNHDSLIIHTPKKGVGTAENFLYLIRPDGKVTKEEIEILDLLLVLQAEHGGGNNSSFATHVVSSTGTDTYSAIATALGSLKGPKHGGANKMVSDMFKDIKDHISLDYNEDSLKEYLRKILKKEVFDNKGLIYGLGHAVYTLSDPRAIILKEKAYQLALLKGRVKEYNLYADIERYGCALLNEKVKNDNSMAANVDFYAGFVLDMLNIPEDLYTPVFAISRIAGWSAHRLEQILDDKIMRPAYITLGENQTYKPLSER